MKKQLLSSAAWKQRYDIMIILNGYRPFLKDAAEVNATRYAISRVIKAFIPNTQFWSGGRTKKKTQNKVIGNNIGLMRLVWVKQETTSPENIRIIGLLLNSVMVQGRCVE